MELETNQQPGENRGALQAASQNFRDLLLPNLTVVFAGLLALSYGITRPAYDAFYSSLGLTPDDLGLSEIQIIFRVALNLARESLVLAALALLASLMRGRLGAELGASAPLKIRKVLALVVPIVAITVLAGLLISAVKPNDREAVLVGFIPTIALAICMLPLVLVGRQRRIAIYAAMLVLACASVLFQEYQDGARAAGRSFSRTATVSGVWGFVLNIRNSRVQIVEVSAKDPAHVCSFAGAHYRYLGGSDSRFFILVLRRPSFVAELPTTSYSLHFLQRYGPTPCVVAKR